MLPHRLHPPPYRPDVDGLRAVAIAFVFLFHCGMGASGGFVGVDVFFVISGFLIASSILQRRDAATFTFIGFYERRARRLAPGFFVVVLACLVVGYLVLLPGDFSAMLASVRASVTLQANHFFYRDMDYFSASATSKPLLHIWSLAIEEQFYLLLPVILVVSLRLRRGTLVIATLATGSLIASAIVIPQAEQAVFYLLPFRAWELLVGVLVAIASQDTPLRLHSSICETVSALAICILAWCSLAYDAGTHFPGLAAAPVVAATAAIIYVGRLRATRVNRALASSPLTYVGRRSYALYLWHWPLVCFTAYYLDRAFSVGEVVGLAAASLLLADITFRLIETPALRRHPSYFRSETLATAGAAAVLLYIALPFVKSPLASNEAINALLKPERNWSREQAQCADRSAQDIVAGLVCNFGSDGPVKVLLLGDSHASSMLPVLKDLAGELNFRLVTVLQNGCPPFHELQSAKPTCIYVNRATEKLIAASSFDAVVFSANWQSYGRSNAIYAISGQVSKDGPEMTAALVEMVRTAERSAAVPILVGQVPTYAVDVPKFLAKAVYFSFLDKILGVKREMPQATSDSLLVTAVADITGARAVYPADSLCSRETCETSHSGESLYKDGGHLTPLGASRLRPALRRELQAAIGERLHARPTKAQAIIRENSSSE